MSGSGVEAGADEDGDGVSKVEFEMVGLDDGEKEVFRNGWGTLID